MSNAPPLPHTASGSSLWPYGIVGLLGLAVASNLWMVKIAVSHPFIPTSQDHWQESLDFERQLQEQAKAASLGWHVDVRTCVWQGSLCQLALRIVDRTQKPVDHLQGHVELWRADSAAFDRRIPFADEGDGVYTASIALPSAGRYVATLTLFRDGVLWKRKHELTYDPQNSMSLLTP